VKPAVYLIAMGNTLALISSCVRAIAIDAVALPHIHKHMVLKYTDAGFIKVADRGVVQSVLKPMDADAKVIMLVLMKPCVNVININVNVMAFMVQNVVSIKVVVKDNHGAERILRIVNDTIISREPS
jgi:hypothetical protein